MITIKKHLQTPNFSPGVNTKEYIVVHHTATGEGSINGVLAGFTQPGGRASCHDTIDTNGDIYQIADDDAILWHAGISLWQGRTNLNKYSIGIEIIGPLGKTATPAQFTDASREGLRRLVFHLHTKYKTPEEKILRHKDISPGRKVDPYDTLWSRDFPSWSQYRKFLITNPLFMTSKYTKIFESVIKETGFDPIFDLHDGDAPLNEQEIKELIEIAFARFAQRNGLR